MKAKSFKIFALSFMFFALLEDSNSFGEVRISRNDSGQTSAIINTKRLNLRSVTIEDINDGPHSLIREYIKIMGDSVTMRTYGSGEVRTPESVMKRMNFFTSKWNEGSPFHDFAVFLDGILIGDVALAQTSICNPEQVEFTLFLYKDYWKQGFGSEMAKAIFNEYIPELSGNDLIKGITEVIATVAIDNEGSQKILEKVGLERVEKKESRGRLSYIYKKGIKHFIQDFEATQSAFPIGFTQ